MKGDATIKRAAAPDLSVGCVEIRTEAISKDLQRLDEALTAVVGGILQESSRAAGTIIGVATSKLVAACVVAGTFSGIAAIGVAGTGTAIASLSGAAATTATLYWIGSSIGLGVAAGSLMLTGGAVAVGIPAAIAVRRRLLGRRRTEEDLDAHEQAALYAALRLAAPVRALRAARMPLAPVEMRVFARQGLMPLAAALENLYAANPRIDGDSECTPRPKSLAYWPRRRILRAVEQIKSITERWAEA
jgi:hypothetical protein